MMNRRNLKFVDKIIEDHIKIHELLERSNISDHHIQDDFITKDGRKYKVRIRYELVE